MFGLLSTGDAAVIVALIGLIGGVQLRNRRDLKEINKAVNHVAEGEPTLIEQVGWLRECVGWTIHANQEIAKTVGVPLDAPPEPLQKKEK